MSLNFLISCIGQLSIADLKVVRSAVWEARTQWRNIGIELNLIVTDLDAIKDGNSDSSSCLTEMLTLWLKQVDPPPSWSALVIALKQPTIGELRLAQQVEDKYIGTDSTDISSEVAKFSFPLITKVAPNEQAREELEHRLRVESEDIMQKFRILRNKLFDSIEEQNISVDKLVEYIEEEISDALQQQTINSEPSTLKDVKQFIKKNSSFYDYQLIKYMIELTGTDKDKDRLEQYERAFSVYAKRRVYECPSIFSTSDNTRSEFHVKLDSIYDECKLEELKKKFQYRLCSILGISVYVCLLKTVETGCFLASFTVPSYIERIVFPLSAEQEKALWELGIVQLVCGDYCFPRRKDQV